MPTSAPTGTEASRRIWPPLWGVLILAALVIVGAGVRSASDIIGPVFLALTLVITFQPMRRKLEKIGLPSWVATGVVLIAIYGVLLLIIGSVAYAIARLAITLPTYAAKFTSLYNTVIAELAKLGLGTAQLQSMLSGLNVSSFTGVAQTLLSGVSNGLSLVVLLVTVLIFLAADASGVGRRLERISESRHTIALGFTDFAGRVRSYWVVTTVFGLIVAVVDLVPLFVLGVPLALIWGLLAFVTNYIPNVGFVIGVIPPALVALLDGGVWPMIWVIVAFAVINFVIQTVLQPRFTGDAVDLAPTIAFLSLIFWAYLLGVLGALLAVPATLFLKSMLVDHGDRDWVRALLDTNETDEKKRKKKKKHDQKSGRQDAKNGGKGAANTRSGNPAKTAGSRPSNQSGTTSSGQS